MRIPLPPRSKKPPSAAEQLAEIVENNGSLTSLAPGTLFKGDTKWDMSAPWKGEALVCFDCLSTLWSKSWAVRFYDTRMKASPVFVLHLSGMLDKQQVEQQAEIWLMALNVRREE